MFLFLVSFSAPWWPDIWPKIGFPERFEKTIGPIYFIPALMGWVSWPLYIFVFLVSFSAPWWPNIWPKMGFLERFEKTIGLIHVIPGIYPYGVSLLTPIHFRVPNLIFGPLVAKYLAENGVSGIKKKNICLIHYIPGSYPLRGWVSWPLFIFVFLASFSALWCSNIWPKIGFWMRWVVIRAGVYCPHLWAQLVKIQHPCFIQIRSINHYHPYSYICSAIFQILLKGTLTLAIVEWS